jgi:uracil-DNA glycosylase
MTTGDATPKAESHAALDAIGARALLDWYRMAGVDAAVDDAPIAAWSLDAEATSTPVAPSPPRLPAPIRHPVPAIGEQAPSLLVPEGRRIGHAREVAARCGTLAELKAALADFDGCALKATARQVCFADGNPEAQLMVIGEAPGAEEDRQGKPFVGQSGQFLDRILAEVGIDRTRAWITNVIFWRPPGNRPPTDGEIAVCQPFLERQIELLAPRFILFVGGIAAKALLGKTEGVTKLRGRPFIYTSSDGRAIPCLVTFHPAYLLRQPLNKRFVWRDMLQLRARLDELEVACG